MIPAAVTTSFACILPVSSTPSAMVFTMGYFRVYDLVNYMYIPVYKIHIIHSIYFSDLNVHNIIYIMHDYYVI